MTEEGYPPREPEHPARSRRSYSERPGGSPRPREPRGTGWQVIDAFDDGSGQEPDLPPWAGPVGVAPQRAARGPQRVPVPERRSPGGGGRAGSGLDELDQERWESPNPTEGVSDRPDGVTDRTEGVSDRPERASDRPERIRRRPGRGRAAAARRRRSKRRLLTWGTAAIIVVVIVGGVLFLTRSPAPKSRFVTSLQKGELRAVPDACKVVGAAALRQLMSGTPARIQPQQGPAQSQCTYTVDAKPTFRVVNVDLQAMQANLVPVGNGSATADARYTFGQQRDHLAKPPKRTAQPPATIADARGLGDQAFSAVQAFHARAGQPATDLVTVVARYRNALITVSVQGQNGGGFGPVSVVAMRSAALTLAHAALARVKAEPTV